MYINQNLRNYTKKQLLEYCGGHNLTTIKFIILNIAKIKKYQKFSYHTTNIADIFTQFRIYLIRKLQMRRYFIYQIHSRHFGFGELKTA